MTSEKLAVRSAIKKRKPTFIRRQGIRQFSKLKKSGWRAPKGMGNKQRRGRKGQPIKPTTGFGSPKEVRGLNRNGLLEVLVFNVADLENISKGQIAVIGSTVGAKKKLEILNFAKSKKLLISNVKDIDAEIKNLTKVKKTPAKKETKKVEKKAENKKTKKEVEAKKWI